MADLGWAGVDAHIDVEVELDDDAEDNAELAVIAALESDPRIKRVLVTRTVQVLGS